MQELIDQLYQVKNVSGSGELLNDLIRQLAETLKLMMDREGVEPDVRSVRALVDLGLSHALVGRWAGLSRPTIYRWVEVVPDGSDWSSDPSEFMSTFQRLFPDEWKELVGVIPQIQESYPDAQGITPESMITTSLSKRNPRDTVSKIRDTIERYGN